MGKSLPTTTTGFKNLRRIISSEKTTQFNPKQAKPTSQNTTRRVDSGKLSLKTGDSAAATTRVPLSMMVRDCAKRWFHDTLKEAKNGDNSMQLLVGQMYNSGYGVCKDLQKGHAWINRASRGRSSAWRVSNKQPGYNASDSDSEDLNDARR